MSHYVIPGGPFEVEFEHLRATGWKLNLESAMVAGPRGGRKPPVKFVCQHCCAVAKGKPDLNVVCGRCLLAARPDMLEAVADYGMIPPGFAFAPEAGQHCESGPDLKAAVTAVARRPYPRHLRTLIKLVRAAGFRPTVANGRHYRIKWTDAHGAPRSIVISRTPSCRSSHANMLGDLRRALRPATEDRHGQA